MPGGFFLLLPPENLRILSARKPVSSQGWDAMIHWPQLLLGCYAVFVLIALLRHIFYSHSVSKTPQLGRQDAAADPRSGPLVSILIPAKDEEASIETCVRSLLAQEYDNLEILVADDRSRDRTANIVRSLEQESPKVRLVQIEHLPPGWTGKTNALHQCQEHAKGEWLLFVDADTSQHPKCLGVVLQDAIAHDVDCESLLPALESRSFWERVIQPFAGICLMVLYPLHRVNDPKEKDLGFANGQFILIRRRIYDEIGGHAAVRDKFVEDIHIGRRVRQAARNLRVVLAADLSAVRMYASLKGIVAGWSRILYSAVDARPLKLYLLFASVCLFSLLSYLVLIGAGVMMLSGGGPYWTWAFGLGAVHQFAQTTLMARVYRASRSRLRYLALRPLAVLAMLYILARTIHMCQTHDVTWRGTSYDKSLQTASGA